MVTILKKGNAAPPSRYPRVNHQEPVITATTPPPAKMEIVDFQVNLDGKNIEVAWQTQNEVPGTEFEVGTLNKWRRNI